MHGVRQWVRQQVRWGPAFLGRTPKSCNPNRNSLRRGSASGSDSGSDSGSARVRSSSAQVRNLATLMGIRFAGGPTVGPTGGPKYAGVRSSWAEVHNFATLRGIRFAGGPTMAKWGPKSSGRRLKGAASEGSPKPIWRSSSPMLPPKGRHQPSCTLKWNFRMMNAIMRKRFMELFCSKLCVSRT